jgi:hypothetical protein
MAREASRRAAAKRGSGGAVAARGESLADIIARMQLDAATPMQRLAMDFEAMMERISAATGTAAERALALSLAEADLAKARAALIEESLSGLRDLKAEIEGDILGRKSQRSQVIAARGAFESARAGLNLQDPESVAAFEAAARRLREIVGAFDATLREFGGAGTAAVGTTDQSILNALSFLPAMGSTSFPSSSVAATGQVGISAPRSSASAPFAPSPVTTTSAAPGGGGSMDAKLSTLVAQGVERKRFAQDVEVRDADARKDGKATLQELRRVIN